MNLNERFKKFADNKYESIDDVKDIFYREKSRLFSF